MFDDLDFNDQGGGDVDNGEENEDEDLSFAKQDPPL